MAKDRIIPSRSVQDLETLVNKKLNLKFDIKGDTPLREINLETITLERLTNIVATLIKDLKK
jgi:hypothetical protein